MGIVSTGFLTRHKIIQRCAQTFAPQPTKKRTQTNRAANFKSIFGNKSLFVILKIIALNLLDFFYCPFQGFSTTFLFAKCLFDRKKVLIATDLFL
jgi:hypothetical protein